MCIFLMPSRPTRPTKPHPYPVLSPIPSHRRWTRQHGDSCWASVARRRRPCPRSLPNPLPILGGSPAVSGTEPCRQTDLVDRHDIIYVFFDLDLVSLSCSLISPLQIFWSRSMIFSSNFACESSVVFPCLPSWIEQNQTDLVYNQLMYRTYVRMILIVSNWFVPSS
jgi:hypothetical protein